MTRLMIMTCLLLLAVSCKTFSGGSSLRDDETDPDFRNTIKADHSETLFFAEGFGKPRWVKFIIVLGESPRIYFQNSDRFRFHYDFAAKKVPEFLEQPRDQFDRSTLYREDRKAILGAVIAPSDPVVREYGVQLVGNDEFTAEEVINYVNFVKSKVTATDAPFRHFYMPTYKHSRYTGGYQEQLLAAGIETISSERWVKGDQCYTFGWSSGRLNYVSSAEIEAAYHAGRLRPTDILVTDGVPDEIPSLAGILSLSPSTPNSHVALLAHSFGIPFAYVKDETTRARLQEWNGRYIAIEAVEAGLFGGSMCSVRAIDLQDRLSANGKEHLEKLRRPVTIDIHPYDPDLPIKYDLDALPEDSLYKVGGKAANFRYLRSATPDNSPKGIALTFQVWERVMQIRQTLDEGFGLVYLPPRRPPPTDPDPPPTELGIKLGDDIKEMLAGYNSYPPANFAEISGKLKDIRKMIKNVTLPGDLQRDIKQALQGFDPNRKIRFRSSTNVEDTAAFSGAGLYDSYSGCLADDLDNDDTGPSHCDPEEDKEKGVFRAIKKVLASFYNENAYLERLRHGINEDDTAMAILVHYSFPDEIELANGVVTYSVGPWSKRMKIVSQPGANSVTNPDPGVKPEVVQVDIYDNFTGFTVDQYSSLSGLGSNVLTFQTEYEQLVALLQSVGNAFAAGESPGETYTLDFEYKKTRDGGLIVKQVRVVPNPDTSTRPAPILLAGQAEYCVFQGEQSNVFAIHRLKSRWQIEFREMLLRGDQETSPIISSATTWPTNSGETTTNSSSLAERPGYSISIDSEANHRGYTFTEAFRENIGGETVNLVLATGTEQAQYASSLPLVFPEELYIQLSAEYPSPKPTFDQFNFDFGQTNKDYTQLTTCQDREEVEGRIVRTVEFAANNHGLKTTFHYPPNDQGIQAGYTAPLIRWEGSTLTGFTTEPLRLRSYFSQSNRPGHHNFSDRFIYQPSREPGLSAEVRAELEAKNIDLIMYDYDDIVVEGGQGAIFTFDKEGNATTIAPYPGFGPEIN